MPYDPTGVQAAFREKERQDAKPDDEKEVFIQRVRGKVTVGNHKVL